jgi:hypothetical protein
MADKVGVGRLSRASALMEESALMAGMREAYSSACCGSTSAAIRTRSVHSTHAHTQGQSCVRYRWEKGDWRGGSTVEGIDVITVELEESLVRVGGLLVQPVLLLELTRGLENGDVLPLLLLAQLLQ